MRKPRTRSRTRTRKNWKDPRLPQTIAAFRDLYRDTNGLELHFDGSDRKAVSVLLKNNRKIGMRALRRSAARFLTSTDPFHQRQGHPMRYWASNINVFLRPDARSRRRPRLRSKGGCPLDTRIQNFLQDPSPTMLEGLRRDVERARAVFGRGSSHKYLDLAEWIGEEHRILGWKMLRILGIGQLTLCREYLEWIQAQDWMRHKSPSMLDPKGRMFERFRREWAGQETMGRDPITGNSVV